MPDFSPLKLTLRFLVVVVLVCFNSDFALSQAFFRPIVNTQSGRLIEAPRSVQQQLREAERAIENRNFSDAVVRLGELLQRDQSLSDDAYLHGQDFFLDVDEQMNGGGSPQMLSRNSLLHRAREIIGSLPPQALDMYELRYGPLARKTLADAAESRDWDQVAEVRRKFFHAKAGYEASLLLAQRDLYAGHALSASLLLDDVVVSDAAVAHLGQSVKLIYAVACRAAGREWDASLRPVGEIMVHGERESIPADVEMDNWMDERFSGGNPINAKQNDYPYFGGQADRNDRSLAELPLANERWQVDTTASPRQTRTLRELSSGLASNGKLLPPSWTPIRVGNQLLMRTTERLVGVDYRTGKRVWMYPWFSTNKNYDSDPDNIDFDALSDEDDANNLLSQRVWNDLPYGQITSDGKRVFMLDDLGEVEMATFSPIMGMRGTRPSETSANTLVALDLETEGKLAWRLGRGDDRESSLKDAFFLGPPLPLDGKLYVMAEIAGDILLVCLNPATGDELWRQHLVAVETGGVDSDPLRRVAGATPTYHEGVLVCPTSTGACVAIDLVDRMLRWGATYVRSDEIVRGINTRARRGIESSQLMLRWYNGGAVAADQYLLITPIESDKLYGFNLLSGEMLFPPKDRITMRYLAGIRDGKFLLVGANQVGAYALPSGDQLWMSGLDALSVGQLISGRGAFAEHSYLLPTSTNEIVKLSLEDGEVVDRRQLRFPLGNLVAADGELISQTATQLSVSYGEKSLGPKVELALKSNPKDTLAIVRKAELLLQAGERDEALALLAEAREREPDNDEVLMLSVSAMLDSLRDAPVIDGAMVETLDELIYEPDQRLELLALQVRAAFAEKRYEVAVEKMVELSALASSQSTPEDAASRIVSEAGRQCTLDAWLSARGSQIADDLIRRNDSEQLNRVNETVLRLLSNKRIASDGLLQTLASQFRSLEGVKPIRDELFDRYVEDAQWLRAFGLLLGSKPITSESVAELSTDRLIELAKIYTFDGFGEDGLAVLDRLRERNDAPDGKSLAQMEIETEAAVREFEWPENARVIWEPLPRRTRATMSFRQQIADTTIQYGEEFRDWRLNSEGAFALGIRDPNGDSRVIPLRFESQQRDMRQNEAKIAGGMMVVITSNALIGVDLHRLKDRDAECVLWQHNLSSDGTSQLNRRSRPTRFGDQVYHYKLDAPVAKNGEPRFSIGPLQGDQVVALQGGDLMAFDQMTGDIRWRNAGAPLGGMVLSDGKEIAVISEMEKRVFFYNTLDGSKLREASWDHGMLWAGEGKHALCYQEIPDRSREFYVRLVNPFNQNVVLEKTTYEANRTTRSIPGSYGRIVNGRYFAMLDTEGIAEVWDIVDGSRIAKLQTESYEDLIGMQASAMGQTLYLFAQRRAKAIRNSSSPMLQTRQSNEHETVNAVFAISLKTANDQTANDDVVDNESVGELLWQKEFDEAWGCTIAQPGASPVLMFSRAYSKFSPVNPRVRTRTLDFMALDRHDGHEVVSVYDKEVPSSTNELETQIKMPNQQPLIFVSIGLERLQLTFGTKQDLAIEAEDTAAE
ncbi:outer membrane protein assembly factor BamB family protein [Novipirellula aureliae]|uniref:outer membrane protein assembly factor BamB family protein n=1 Tax=Novipirellula aureliae TaxID=2527966 RepID=UPI0018CF77FD|nr:PQQ-binding-like beta-propeller repeat protein [Novipirellula aureliae]